MKTVILCGGLGARLAEETDHMPKPMVQIGNKPILLHIINYYSKFHYNKIIVCSGYKHEKITNYFSNNNNIKVVDTGLYAQTCSRIKKIKNLNVKKRPISVVADNFEVRNAKKINIKIENKIRGTGSCIRL